MSPLVPCSFPGLTANALTQQAVGCPWGKSVPRGNDQTKMSQNTGKALALELLRTTHQAICSDEAKWEEERNGVPGSDKEATGPKLVKP